MTTEQNTEQQIGGLTLAAPVTSPTPLPYPVPEPDRKWDLRNGFAWIYYGEGSSGIERPVVMADGFNLGKSDLSVLYAGLDRDYPLITKLRQQGRTVILLGFQERTASIYDNAAAAKEAILRTVDERADDSLLAVGGFSMGGLVTRYALAELETQRVDHQTALYFSYDTPHRGAVIPIGIQAFAHFIPTLPGKENDFARQIDSPAARQMLYRHYGSEDGSVGEDLLRTEFLRKLEELGGWPRIPRLIAVANGTGDGTGLNVAPGQMALKSTGAIAFPGSTFHTQATGDGVTVAELRRLLPPASKTVKTDGLPEFDGAPGGTLDSYGIIAKALEDKGGKTDLRHPTVCFVPSVSAVAIRDIGNQDDLYTKIDVLSPDESELDEFLCSSTTTGHTQITAELCDWIMERLPN
ncbi:lipase family alpha/beta hydrolase [Streptomyces sp. NPDC088725]|uniref:lipase family alpha/beta hydrolase n=1 Tax=Streptomyces sp. NPDC088725 TaxID=3365873 RepID=UPI0038210FBA